MNEYFSNIISINCMGNLHILANEFKYLEQNSFISLDEFEPSILPDFNISDSNIQEENVQKDIKSYGNDNSISEKIYHLPNDFVGRTSDLNQSSKGNSNITINNYPFCKIKRCDIFTTETKIFFKIFHPGNNEEYPRKFINSILDKKIIIILPQRSKEKKNRKYYSDNIRKKIKARFLKALKCAINKRLKNAGSKCLFNYLPQSFVADITKEGNKNILDITFKELLSKDFAENGDIVDKKNAKKTNHNIGVIKYLEQNEIIGKKSNYIYYKNMKYKEIYLEYLKSREFEKDINKLKEEKENEDYIKKYIKLSINLNDFFLSEDI